MCMQNVQRRAPMGVTVGDRSWPDRKAMTEEELRAPSAIALEVEKINAHIRHWRDKSLCAGSPVESAIADGYVSGLQLARLVHGLPLLTSGLEVM